MRHQASCLWAPRRVGLLNWRLMFACGKNWQSWAPRPFRFWPVAAPEFLPKVNTGQSMGASSLMLLPALTKP